MTPDFDRFAHLDTFLHRWDPRWKLVSLAFFLLALAVEHPASRHAIDLRRDIPPAVAALGLSLGLILASRIPLSFVIRRLRAPAIFLGLLLVLFPLAHPEKDLDLGLFELSTAGFSFAGMLVLQALAMLLLAFPAFATTRFESTLKALRRLRVPVALLQVVFFAYRYLFVYADQSLRIRKTMRARGLRARLDLKTVRALGNGLGALLVTSIDRTHRIHDAMRSRGYSGAFRSLDAFRTRPADVLLFSAALLASGALAAWRFL